jgi:hypothetical protein
MNMTDPDHFQYPDCQPRVLVSKIRQGSPSFLDKQTPRLGNGSWHSVEPEALATSVLLPPVVRRQAENKDDRSKTGLHDFDVACNITQ